MVNIVKTAEKGWGTFMLKIFIRRLSDIVSLGVFAGPKKIPAGTFVGIYAGELLKEAVCGEERGLWVYFFPFSNYFDFLYIVYDSKYNVFGRTYLFNIDGYHLQQEDPDWEPIYVVDAYHAGNVSIIFLQVIQLANTEFPLSSLGSWYAPRIFSICQIDSSHFMLSRITPASQIA